MVAKTRSLFAIARFGRGYTQAQLARLAGVGTSTIGRIERGEREPSAELVTFLESFFERPLFMPRDVR